MDYYDQVSDAAASLRERLPVQPQLGVVLGSGLGAFADRVEQPTVVPYAEIPHMPASVIVGHAGRLVAGRAAGHDVVVLSGRVHYYEGHDLRTVTFATRMLGLLGVRTLILTNAAGGVNTGFSQGALMIVDDHLNLLGSNPLMGPNDERFGPRFPDMTEVYSVRLRRLADEVARGRASRSATACTPRCRVRAMRRRPRSATFA
jgi:purine-nucleoside phosphorylase